MKDRETISQYLSDESNAFSATPENVLAVYFPETEQELVEAVRGSSEKITTSGAGTGITGSRVPVHGGLVISTEKLLRPSKREGCRELFRKGLAGDILIYLDEENNLAHVGPGISITELADTLPRGFMYPPDPTETSASLGGTVATNASGARCFYYGPTRSWIMGLRIVLANGETIGIRRGECFADNTGHIRFTSEHGREYDVLIPSYETPDIKNAAGLYSRPGMDLIDLFIGSEGILGIISEITLKLVPAGKESVSDLAFFESEGSALDYVDSIRNIKESGILAIEYFDRTALNFVRGEHPEIRENLAAGVYVEAKAESMNLMDEIARLLARFGASEDWYAHTMSTRRDLKEFRHSLPDCINTYLKQHSSYKLGTDFVVPVAKFREMVGKYREIGERFRVGFPREGAHYVIFGHIGDCHLHFNFITESEEERTAAKKLYIDLARYAVSLGGTISGEHGVGKKTLQVDGRTVPYLELMYGESGLAEIARVKRELDPGLRFNVENMVPPD